MSPRLLLALILLLAGPMPARAQVWPPESTNPQPLDDDLILPMPCGGAMAFRPIATPGEVNDILGAEVTLGNDGYAAAIGEVLHTDRVAGPFPDPGGGAPLFYLGKYEVTIDQYEAVRLPTCGDPTPLGSRPASDVTWQEALAFGHAYTLWLLENAPETLPAAGPAFGFLRLPTATEWEYAARGGSAVSEADFRRRVFPMEGDIGGYAWYQGPDSANGRLRPIGLLRPNPLGLHDVLGNAEELVFDPLRVGGLIGGFTTMGGSIQTPGDRLRTSMRMEYFYIDPTRNAPTRIDTFGFRLAISAPIQTSFERIAEIRRVLQDAPPPAGAVPAGRPQVPAFDPADWERPGTLDEAVAATVMLRDAFAAILADTTAEAEAELHELEQDYDRLRRMIPAPEQRDPFETEEQFDSRRRVRDAALAALDRRFATDRADLAARTLERQVRRLIPVVDSLSAIQAQSFSAPGMSVSVEMLAPQPEQSRIPLVLGHDGDQWPSYWAYEDVAVARRVWQHQAATGAEALVALGPGYPDEATLKQVIVQVRLSNPFGPAERVIAVDDVAPFPELAALDTLRADAEAARIAAQALRDGAGD
ncbi:MAG: SUMF1/EgtB/PvdO family nonheme iron enzyme [Rhodospirillaceae bacterium]|nr:SUMF1/EgtB/PvdO family nonheme iron enzyme [Rhodospirillaceae bacterium]